MGVTVDQRPPLPEEEKALTFKDAVAADIDTVFFNLFEFAETHKIDGKEMLAIVDENELLDRASHWEAGAKQSFDSGLYKGDILLYVKKEDYGPKPKVAKRLVLDGRNYQVADCTEEAGVYAITITRIRQ